jgi:parallel beta-helix repeat protein
VSVKFGIHLRSAPEGWLNFSVYRHITFMTDRILVEGKMNRAVIQNLIILACFISPALGEVHLVPVDYATIQVAIDDCKDGDTIIITPGIYTGDGNRDIDFKGKAITVMSEEGPETCIIDCASSKDRQHRGFDVYSNTDVYAILDGFTIKNGYVDEAGGGVLCGTNALVRNCVLVNNNAEHGGGIYAGESIVSNCVIAFNTASKGGGIYATRGSPFFINCTIIGNRALGQGGGIACGYRGTTTMTNCIIVGNRAELGNQLWAHNEGRALPSMDIKVRNCCIQSDSCADIGQDQCLRIFTGMMKHDLEDIIYSSNPRFVNPEGSDYRLHPDSPCVDAGTNIISIELPSTDIYGNPRISDGDRDGNSLPDIGAYEVPRPDQSYIWSSTAQLEFVAAADGPNPESQILNIKNLGLETLRWTIQNDSNWLQVTPNNGSTEQTSIDVVVGVDISNLESGKYTCDLIVSGENALNSPQTIPVMLYLTKAIKVPSQYATVQDAVDAANPYDTIVIADGIYQNPESAEIKLGAKPITLSSENGPSNCIIDTKLNLIPLSHAVIFDDERSDSTILNGLSIKSISCDRISPKIRNCYISNNSTNTGIYLLWSDAIITNCYISNCKPGIFCKWSDPIISECALQNNNGNALYCTSGSPQVFSCDISNNTASAISTYYCLESQITDCHFTNNGRVEKAPSVIGNISGYLKFENCTVSNNYSGFSFYGCTNVLIKNCIISGNGRENNEGGHGVYLEQSGLLIDNSTLVGNSNHALYYGEVPWFELDKAVVRNSIFYDNKQSQIAGNTNLISVTYSNIQGGWIGNDNINIDPLFADPGYWSDSNDSITVWIEGDYHLKSQAGRYDPDSGSWVIDDVTSPCIDAGDPNSPIGDELEPNGGRINMGAYGGTTEASKSYFDEPPSETIIAGDINGDFKVDFQDFAIIASHWLENGY